ncbi:MAG: murein hydrolase activator EnvC family protein [Eubacteriaceae bacterium]
MKNKRIISGIVTGSMLFAFAVAPVYGASLSEQLAESNARQAAARYQVDMTQNTIAGIQGEIEKVNAEVERINGVISTIDGEIAVLEENIGVAQAELQIAEGKKGEQEEAMSDRVRTLYMYGNTSLLEFLFTSTNFSDFFAKLDMSRYIIEADKESLKAIAETQKVIDAKKQSIETDRLKTVEKKVEQEQSLIAQQQIIAEKDQLIAQNKVVVAEYTAIEEAEAAAAVGISNEIAAYYAEQERLAAERAAQDAANNSGTVGGGSGGGDESGGGNTGGNSSGGGYNPPPSFSGSVQWPCGGTITSPFGYRICDFHGPEFHSGVDIGAPTGTPVAAGGDARVISAGWMGEYGNCIIIDLGGGVSALYAHLSAINVSAGQSVSRGETIGRVGSTGNSTGPHLHYEIAVYGSVVNPQSY